jgi:hypothetical protein
MYRMCPIFSNKLICFLVKELVEINGTTFYINVNANGFSREEAIALCNTQNMTLLSFENATEKWENVNNWLEINGMRNSIEFLLFICVKTSYKIK